MADKIRVLRLIEYVGERSAVELQLKTSLHGMRQGIKGVEITAVTIGEIPERLVDWDGAAADKTVETTMSVEEAQRLTDKFAEGFPKIDKLAKEQRAEAYSKTGKAWQDQVNGYVAKIDFAKPGEDKMKAVERVFGQRKLTSWSVEYTMGLFIPFWENDGQRPGRCPIAAGLAGSNSGHVFVNPMPGSLCRCESRVYMGHRLASVRKEECAPVGSGEEFLNALSSDVVEKSLADVEKPNLTVDEALRQAESLTEVWRSMRDKADKEAQENARARAKERAGIQAQVKAARDLHLTTPANMPPNAASLAHIDEGDHIVYGQNRVCRVWKNRTAESGKFAMHYWAASKEAVRGGDQCECGKYVLGIIRGAWTILKVGHGRDKGKDGGEGNA